MKTSEEKYWIAHDLFLKIKDDFYEIENGEHSDQAERIEETLNDAENVLDVLEKINMKVLKKLYSDNIYVITKNVEKFKEQADYVSSILKKMKRYVKGGDRNPLPPEMYPEKERKEWEEQLRKRREAALNIHRRRKLSHKPNI
mgnify:CR=1 FL=1